MATISRRHAVAKIGMLEKRETIAAAEWRTEDRTTRWTQR